jgi:hypothetical protein
MSEAIITIVAAVIWLGSVLCLCYDGQQRFRN